MNILTIQTAVADALADLDIIGSATTGLPAEAGLLPAAAVALPDPIEFFASMGRDKAIIEIKVLAAVTTDETAQATLAGLLSRGVEGNLIDGLASLRKQSWGSLRVIEAKDIGEYVVGSGSYLGFTLTTEVIA